MLTDGHKQGQPLGRASDGNLLRGDVIRSFLLVYNTLYTALEHRSQPSLCFSSSQSTHKMSLAR